MRGFKKNKRVFLGMVDIAGQIDSFRRGYEAEGLSVFTMVYSQNLLSGSKYDFIYNNLYSSWILENKKLFLLRKIYTALIAQPTYWIVLLISIFRCDIFHFMWFLRKENRLILWLLKILSKKVIVSFVGSDIRWYPVWVQEFDNRGLTHRKITDYMEIIKSNDVSLASQLRTVRIYEKYSDIILSVPEQSQLLLKPYFNFFLPLELNRITFKLANNQVPKVCIGVTNPKTKNSINVISAVKDYREQTGREFEIIVLQNMFYEDVLEALSESDIFIYSPYVCGPGRFGLEAIASGALCMCGYDEDWYNIPPGLPIVPITESDFISKLEYYLDNREERERLIKSGKDWIARYADHKWIVGDILRKLEKPDENYDYIPVYFRDRAKFDFEGNPPNAVDICNKWTSYVKDCDWYKKYVPPGTRDGLIF